MISAGRAARAVDVVVVGAGHNGLVAAGYLARAGLSVTVVEARSFVGGACVTEELIPGFRFSSAAVVLHLLWPKIVRELELRRHGLQWYRTGVDRVGIWDDARLVLYQDLDSQIRALAGFGPHEAAGFLELGLRLRRFAALYEPSLLQAPPTLEDLAACFRGRDASLFDEFVLGSIGETMGRYFDCDKLRGFFAFPGMVSVDAGPHTPGTSYVWAHHAVGGLGGELGAHGFVRGGMGGVTQALARSAEAAGASIRTSALVARIVIADGRAVGVELADGSTINARFVVSNADPRRTLLDLVGAGRLAGPLARAVAALDHSGSMARVYLALRELPRFESAPHRGAGPADVHRAFALLGADLGRFSAAHEAQRCGAIADEPVLELTIQSSSDPTLAPRGLHTATLGIQQVARELRNASWDDERERFGDPVVARLCRFAPNIEHAVIGVVLRPRSISSERSGSRAGTSSTER